MSHAAPKVTKVNDPAAKAKPTMYQIPVNRSSLRAAPATGDARNERPLLGRDDPWEAVATDRLARPSPAGILAAAASAGGFPRGAAPGPRRGSAGGGRGGPGAGVPGRAGP